MFNRSWYKNTWLGKKLGLKIDWSKEVLVHKNSSVDSVRVIHTNEDGIYVGFRAYVVSGIKFDGSIHKRVETEMMYTWEDNSNLDDYVIMYDQSKVDALQRIHDIEESKSKSVSKSNEKVYIVVKTGMDEKEAHEYMFSAMFLREASKFIQAVDVSHLVRLKWGVRLVCNEEDASELRMLVSKHKQRSKTKHIF